MKTAFDSISIKIASPQEIKALAKQTCCKRRSTSQSTREPFICPEMGRCNCGEVRKAETINYRSLRPEPEGLFCEAIFGPQKDFECSCGKYKRIKHKGVICDRCGVEVTQQRVRRQRLGYIQLAAPVSHIWFFKGIPSRIGTFCNLSSRQVERIIYFEAFVVVSVSDPDCPLQPRQVLTELEYEQAKHQYPGQFRAGTGAEVISEILNSIDLQAEKEKLTELLSETTSHQKKLKISKQLKQLSDFAASEQRPEWMIMDVIPVIPPDLRPLVSLEGGRFATSDLNDLYRRVINRNNRLRKLIQLRSPEVILRNEKRMLQEAVDAFFDNGRHGRRVAGPGNRPLKSLSDILKGKVGRFRQNLLGKRVDYSGRSVIVVGPELGLHQCGLPKRMAVELFKPFIIERLQAYNYTQTIKRAKHIAEHVESNSPVWEVLEEVIADHPVLLNRPPTLHRLGIQAFLPVLVEGKSIRIPPLVCKAFNADFDGDQMAVHVPLTVEAQAEAKLLMLSSHNILKPSHGGPIAVPELDMVLGPSFLTKELPGHAEDAKLLHEFIAQSVGAISESRLDELRQKPWYHRRYSNTEEVIAAHAAGQLKLHDSLQLFFGESSKHESSRPRATASPILTTVGRVIFNEVLPDKLKKIKGSSSEDAWIDEHSRQQVPFFNAEASGRELSKIVYDCFNELGTRVTVNMLEEIQKLAFHYATLSGISPCITDYLRPDNRDALVSKAQSEVDNLLATTSATDTGELENERIRIWLEAIEQVEKRMFSALPELETSLVERGDSRKIHPNVDADGVEIGAETVKGFSPVHIMADSGARARKNPFMQISAIVGLKSDQSNNILSTPITASYREGLDVLDYFNSTYGSRKGLVDTAMKTAASGYLTRKLVDVAQDVRVTTEDCKTLNSIQKFTTEGGSLAFKIRGRTAAEDIIHPDTGQVLKASEQLISEEEATQIEAARIKVVKVRSVLTCQADEGVCSKCYGIDLTTNNLVNVGEAIGIIAAQSIGEPGTQLTMRTFHTGGAVEAISEARQRKVLAKVKGTVRFRDFRPGSTVRQEGNLWIAIGSDSPSSAWETDNKVDMMNTIGQSAAAKQGVHPSSAKLDAPAYKVTQVNHPECPLLPGELLSEKQYTENAQRYKGFETETWQYEVTAVSERAKVNNGYSVLGQHFDYSSDAWKFLSEKYRDRAGWQCEQCGVALKDDKQFLHVHHRRGTKHNEPRDLAALCIGCHAEQPGEGHQKFSSSDEYRQFTEKYGNVRQPSETLVSEIDSLEPEIEETFFQHVEKLSEAAVSEHACHLQEGARLSQAQYDKARKQYGFGRFVTQKYRVTQVLHPDIAVTPRELLTLEKADELKAKMHTGFDGEWLSRDSETGQLFTETELASVGATQGGESEKGEEGNSLQSRAKPFSPQSGEHTHSARDSHFERVYRITERTRADFPYEVGEEVSASDIASWLTPFDLESKPVYVMHTEITGDANSGLDPAEYQIGRELTERAYEEARLKYRAFQVKELDAPKHVVTAVYHPEFPLKVGDVLTTDAARKEHKRFPGFNVQKLKHRVIHVHHPDCTLKPGDLLSDGEEKQFRATFPGITASSAVNTMGPFEAERLYHVTAVNHPECPLQPGELLTQKASSAHRRQYKGFEVQRYYEEVGAISESRQRLSEAQYKSLRKEDPEISGKFTSLYVVVSVHHPDLQLEVGTELTEKEYRSYQRQYKAFDVERVNQVTRDERTDSSVPQFDPGHILGEKEYRKLQKENQRKTYTVTDVFHPNCGHTVGEVLTEEAYKTTFAQYAGFETAELDMRMHIEIVNSQGAYVPHLIPLGYSFSVEEGDSIDAEDTLAELHEKTANRDIVAGIPRVTELFEARRPKRENAAEIAEIEGHVQAVGTKAGVPTYRIIDEGHTSRVYAIPDEKRRVTEGDWVDAGQPLTDGFLNPHDILRIGRTLINGVPVEGEEAVWAYLVDEVQKVYGARVINDKHIEAIVRQMLTKIRVTESGDTAFYPNEEVARDKFQRQNSAIDTAGGTPATGEPILQSISKASLSTDSFISAASFQQTTKVLTDAAVSGQTDRLFGLKENVILGRLIPAGSGFSDFQNIEVAYQGQPLDTASDDDD